MDSNNPFIYSNAMSKNNGMVPTNASRMALDNLLRRELKVGDPNNSQEIAQALLARYKGTPRATAISREAEGVPFLTAPTTAPMMQGMTSSDAEMQQAVDDVNRDLQELTTNTILKDITPELQGWAVAIRSAIMEGFNAARFALDSRQRDKTFGIRRTLGDYARIARFVGALSPSVVNINYRKLAQSIDEVTSVLLVLMGESLANVSFNRSRYLLQVPYSELQSRRDSVIYALRNLNGSTQEAYAPNEWPRGVDAYGQLYKYLERQGQGDLRSLLVENELSRIMDSLIQRAGQGNADGLRHLGATAQLDIQRLRRLVNIIGGKKDDASTLSPAVDPQSPPLTAFQKSLELFVDAFEGSGGFRLLRLARPPILFYGLYGGSTSDQDAETRLVDLAIERNRLAELLDCFLQCGCTPARIKCQIALDKILYDVDRAIDLYALGTTENREPEYRAVAYSYVVDAVLNNTLDSITVTILLPSLSACLSDNHDSGLNNQIKATLNAIRSTLYSPIPLPSGQMMLPSPLPKLENSEIQKLVSQELKIQGDMEDRWKDLVQSMASTCLPFITINNNGGRLMRAIDSDNLGVFDVTKKVLQIALFRATGDQANLNIDFRIDQSSNLPNQYEFSLAAEASASASIETDVDAILTEIRNPVELV